MTFLSDEEHKVLDSLYHRQSGSSMAWYHMYLEGIGANTILVWFCRLCNKEFMRQKWLARSGSKLAAHGLAHLKDKGLLIFL